MAQIVPNVLDAAPVAPDRTDRTTFALRSQNFTSWMATVCVQLGTLAASMYSNAVDAYTNAMSAAASAATASTSSGIVMFNSATTYTQGQGAISPSTFFVYRRKTAGISATEPALDSANWVPTGFAPITVSRQSVNFTAAPSINYVLAVNDLVVTLPSAPGVADQFSYRLAPGISRAVLRSTLKIEGQTAGVDIAVDVAGFRGDLVYNSTDGYLHV